MHDEFGNCKRKDESTGPLKGKFFCYVFKPSSCTDLQASNFVKGEMYSAEPCPQGILKQNAMHIRYTTKYK